MASEHEKTLRKYLPVTRRNVLPLLTSVPNPFPVQEIPSMKIALTNIKVGNITVTSQSQLYSVGCFPQESYYGRVSAVRYTPARTRRLSRVLDGRTWDARRRFKVLHHEGNCFHLSSRCETRARSDR